MRRYPAFARLAALATALLLSACATQQTMDAFPEEPWPEPTEAPPANGAIYQAGTDVALFENATARRVGLRRRIVHKWGERFVRKRLRGLDDAPRSGRPPRFSPSGRAALGQARVRAA